MMFQKDVYIGFSNAWDVVNAFAERHQIEESKIYRSGDGPSFNFYDMKQMNDEGEWGLLTLSISCQRQEGGEWAVIWEGAPEGDVAILR